MIRINKLYTVLMVMALSYFPIAGYSQPGGSGGGNHGTTPAPISGIEILIGLGGLYGVKKMLNRKKNK